VRVLQINSVANSGSTGRIAEEIGNVLIENGHESYIAYGRGNAKSSSQLIKIGSDWDVYLHGAYTLLTDKHGFGSKKATEKLIAEIDNIKPDLIALHNLHGYYLNIEILFNYIKKNNIPVTWTFHDCWPFTGHCSHFENVSCNKWQSTCHICPKTGSYPKSFFDNSTSNFENKKRLFTSIKKMTIITPSNWLKNHIISSFLKHPVLTINNGINMDVFKPSLEKFNTKKYLLFVSSVWTKTKGFDDIISMRKIVPKDIDFVIVGISKKQQENLIDGITGITRTSNIDELIKYYSNAFCLINPTYSDNFPTVNLEAIACGTPVITYNIGGSPEAIDDKTGFVVEKGDIKGVVEKVEALKGLNYEKISKACRLRAEELYDKKTRYLDYLRVFEGMVKS
jgi:glycosyltransferase involved in cell wall biosynthesis